jgi:cysteine desulfurase/selenocysteine lyase
MDSIMDITAIRKEFPITRNYNFQNHAAVAPITQRAAEAIQQCATSAKDAANIEGNFYAHADHVRHLAAHLINADAAEVTFIKNTTEGISFVANGLNWNTGDNVVITNVEFPANVYPWMDLKSRGVKVQMVREESGRIPLDRVIEAINNRTRVVSLSAVQFASGFRCDLAEVGRVCQERGVLFCVDAIQALGVLPIDVRAMNIDFLSADGHKWLCAPEGCGIFYCRRELLEHVHPSTVGWICMKNANDFGNYKYDLLNDARRFDSGSYNLLGIYGLGASLEMFLEIGIDAIAKRVLALTDRLVNGLKNKGYRIISAREPEHASGIVAFTSEVHDHEEIRRHLKAEYRLIIAVREGRLRASPHFYNTEAEIDQLIEVLPKH